MAGMTDSAQAKALGNHQNWTTQHHDFMPETTVAGQAEALANFAQKYSDGRYAGSIICPETIEQLRHFSKQNVVVYGYTIHKIFSDIFGSAEAAQFALLPLYIEVCIAFSNVIRTKKEVKDGCGITIESAQVAERIEPFHTLHGMTFDATVTWVFKRGGVPIRDPITWTQAVVKEARSSYELPAPRGDTREFEVGALMHLMHSDVSISDTLRVSDSSFLYPRHNKAVDDIMAASVNAKALIDFMSSFLAGHTNVTDFFGRVTVPWSVHTMLAPEGVDAVQQAMEVCGVKFEPNDETAAAPHAPAKKPLVDPRVFTLLDLFDGDQKKNFVNLGQISVLLQQLSLLKVYLCHFDECFDLIEEQQVQAFLSGIGKVNGALFEKQQSIDALLLRVALFKANQCGVKLFPCFDQFPACEVSLEARLPKQSFFSTMHAVESRSALTVKHGHVIKFGGVRATGVEIVGNRQDVEIVGNLVRRVFVLPTDRLGTRLPSLQLHADALYGKPVLVSIGAMEGNASNGKKLFLLGDAMQVKIALTAAAIPSNAIFQKSLSLVPQGMRDFMDELRGSDLSQSAICIDVIEMRPLLAKALGIKEEDLVLNRVEEQELLHLIQAGAALVAIKAIIDKPGDATNCKPGDVEPYNISHVFAQLHTFSAEVFGQGERDQNRKRKLNEDHRHLAKQVPMYRSTQGDGYRGYHAPHQYRSLSGRSLSGRSLSAHGGGGRSLSADGGGGHELSADGGGGHDDMDEEEEVDADDGEKSAPTDIMVDLLRTYGDRFDGKTFSACQIRIGEKSVAKLILPSERGGYVEEPHPDDWKTEGTKDASVQKALIHFLETCGTPVHATRIVYYGMYAHPPAAILKHFLSGGETPTTAHVEMFKAAQEILDDTTPN